MTTIHPTHECYDDCAQYLGHALKVYGKNFVENYRLCHGIMIKRDGEPYSHAWLEIPHEDRIIDFGLIDGNKIYKADRQSYYAERSLVGHHEYTMRDIAICHHHTGTSGPWVKKYSDLCTDLTNIPNRIFLKLHSIGTRHVQHRRPKTKDNLSVRK